MFCVEMFGDVCEATLSWKAFATFSKRSSRIIVSSVMFAWVVYVVNFGYESVKVLLIAYTEVAVYGTGFRLLVRVVVCLG